VTSYSTNANVQNTVYGTTNSDLDTVCSNARDIATSIINAKRGYKTDLTTVPDVITRACTLIAAAIVSTGPDQKLEENTYYKTGMLLLDELGEETTEGQRGITIVSEGFGRMTELSHDPTIPW
jgi:hypothetical protein